MVLNAKPASMEPPALTTLPAEIPALTLQPVLPGPSEPILSYRPVPRAEDAHSSGPEPPVPHRPSRPSPSLPPPTPQRRVSATEAEAEYLWWEKGLRTLLWTDFAPHTHVEQQLGLFVVFSAALDVELSDDSFPPEDFGIVSGTLNVKWDRLAPYLFIASNVSHTVVLRPLKAGYFNFTSATITYLAQEGAQVVVGFTSAPGQGGILAQRDFDRRFSPHFLDWAAFGVMTLPSIGIPLLLWYSSKRKYDTPKSKKN
ncbi:translocon-associated protein subunit beta-like [Ammospiza caudacuta]|uniref:translocon-associated protein subunit beta-like n=1 Tax=Ammospiza caudacuta TaxID=2857398 RepID=UPI0027390922|nr:translocon-associated protein subunit beta-like [Ammospiza caudacuta]